MKPYRFHRDADAEFNDALRHYTGIGSELGGRFYDEIEETIADVCAHPRRFRQIDPPVRRHLVPSFPYSTELFLVEDFAGRQNALLNDNLFYHEIVNKRHA